MTELTDSGVSVVSDVAIKDVRLMNWLKESDHKKNDVKHSRHLKKYASQSSNLERAKQPFVADPGMPPLPQPHTVSLRCLIENIFFCNLDCFILFNFFSPHN